MTTFRSDVRSVARNPTDPLTPSSVGRFAGFGSLHSITGANSVSDDAAGIAIVVVDVVVANWIDFHDFCFPTAVHLKEPADVFRI